MRILDASMLLKAGYRQHPCDNPIANNTFYQKVIRSGENKLYFINVTLWYFDKYYPTRDLQTKASCEARLYLPEANQLVGSAGFTLALHLEMTATIDEIEAFYATAYRSLGCVPDLHNQ